MYYGTLRYCSLVRERVITTSVAPNIAPPRTNQKQPVNIKLLFGYGKYYHKIFHFYWYTGYTVPSKAKDPNFAKFICQQQMSVKCYIAFT
jgi:hypothetical protein